MDNIFKAFLRKSEICAAVLAVVGSIAAFLCFTAGSDTRAFFGVITMGCGMIGGAFFQAAVSGAADNLRREYANR